MASRRTCGSACDRGRPAHRLVARALRGVVRARARRRGVPRRRRARRAAGLDVAVGLGGALVRRGDPRRARPARAERIGAMRLARALAPGSEPPPAEGPTPDEAAEVQEAVEELRGLDFTERVVADSATRAELVDGLEESFDYSFPEELLGRRSRAWQAIGVIPAGTSIRGELEAFASGQVIGDYDTLTGELVFIGTDNPSPIERVTLAHELTHAIDDQNFGLERIDVLLTSCRDEASTAAIALVEGDATYFMTAFAFRYLTP